jgi:hypothetical protein
MPEYQPGPHDAAICGEFTAMVVSARYGKRGTPAVEQRLLSIVLHKADWPWLNQHNGNFREYLKALCKTALRELDCVE